jgi:uncharacterized membrane protein
MGLQSELRTSFLTGLLVLAPLAVTFFVLQFVFVRVFAALDPLVRQSGLVELTRVVLVAQMLALTLVLLFVTCLGYLAKLSTGQRLFGGFDYLIGFIPLVSTIYNSVRQVGNALMNRSNRYESVVLVEFAQEGMYSIGFVTGDSPKVADMVAGEKAYNVFLPNSPNPTAGRLVLVPESRVYQTDMSVGRGIRLLVTTGIADTPEELQEFREHPIPTTE